MSSILSQYLPPDTPALRKEFETAYADELDALYQRFLASKARERLEREHPAVLATPVERLDLPPRTITALKGKWLDTVADLLSFSEEDLARIKRAITTIRQQGHSLDTKAPIKQTVRISAGRFF